MRSQRGLGVLAMCGLVLGMMAISTSGAQAGTWMINKANVSTTQTVEATIEIEPLGEKKEKHIVLLSTSGASKIQILCERAEAFKGTITATRIEGSLKFNSCATKVNEKASAICSPLNQPIEVGGIFGAVLHEKVAYAKFTGKEIKTIKEGKEEVVFEPFATLKFNEECAALTPTEKIIGTGWIEDSNGKFESELVTHLIQEAAIPAKALGGLKFGANLLTIIGSANVAFSDVTHRGQTFSGLAE